MELLLDDGVRELQPLQTQILQHPALTDDALQSRGGDDGTGQVQLDDLQRAEPGRRRTGDINTRFSYVLQNTSLAAGGEEAMKWERVYTCTDRDGI